jgi:hypothetical protein
LQGITRANFIAFDTIIMPRKVIVEVGPFNESLKNGMDFEYWWRFGSACLSPAYTEEIVMKRFKVPGSLSGRSLTSIENHLKMLDACAKLSIESEHPKSLAYLKPMYRNAWQNKIALCGETRNIEKAWRAFIKSLDYGFKPGSLRLLLQAICKTLFHDSSTN